MGMRLFEKDFQCPAVAGMKTNFAVLAWLIIPAFSVKGKIMRVKFSS